MAVLVWNALTLFQLWRYPRELPGLLLGVAGNITVALAWFGPPLLDGRLHAYGWQASNAGSILAAFVALQILLLAVALLMPGRSRISTS